MAKHLFYILLAALGPLLLGAQTYTLALQPDTSGFDATVKRASPTTNFGSSTTFGAARNTSSQYERSLLRFNLTGLTPGVTILSAKLLLYGTNHTGTTDNDGILKLVPAAWDENLVTWNTSLLLDASGVPTVSIPAPTSSTQNYTLDVTQMVQGMVNTPLVNFGWLMRLATETAVNNKSLEFASGDNSSPTKRPRLEITYCLPLTVNAYISPSSLDTAHNAGIVLNVLNGVPPYTYTWSSGHTTRDINNVTAGVYKVSVADAKGQLAVKMIPLLTDCGTLTYTLNYGTSGSFSDAALINESFNTSTQNTNFGTAADIKAYNKTGGSGNTIARNLLAFDLGMLPDNFTVSSASLKLTDNQSSFGSTFKVQLCKVLQPWAESTVTFSNQPSYNDSIDNLIEFDYDATQTAYTFDVSQHVQQMIAADNAVNGWLLKLKTEDVSSVGEAASFYGDNSSAGNRPEIVLNGSLPALACDDSGLNWHQEDTYDENGVIISSEKTYMDNLGRGTQHLVKNASSEVFTEQTVYDSYGRPALTSLPAYTGSQLAYHPGFMRNPTGQVYGYNDFDLSTTTLNSPLSPQNGISQTLGYYYSDNNAYDLYQATATNPYTRVEYTGDPGGSPRRVSKPGNAFKMGSNKENYTFTLMSGDELTNVYGSGLSYKVMQSTLTAMDCTPLSNSSPIAASKQVVITPDNVEQISYSAGGKVLASCFSGLSASESCTYTVKNKMMYDGTQNTDLHLPNAYKSSLNLPLPTQPTTPPVATYSTDIGYQITDLYTDKLLVDGTDYSLNQSTRAVTFSGGYLAQYTGRSLMLRISYAYTPSFISTVLAAGAPDMADAEVDYTVDYGRFSKNYYDLSGALLKSVSPKGFACSTPTTISMASTYLYDYKGQLTAMQSPDQGLVQSAYDTEGKLRFTQNAEQYNTDRFSYINYDKHGRPVETGEYQSGYPGNNMWFQAPPLGIMGMVFVSSIVDQADGLPAGGKTNTVIAGYSTPQSSDDVPNTYSYYSLYRNFRAGPLNYIKNNNSSTWFNYDKAGRPTASITQITEADFVSKNPGIDNQVKTSESTYNFYNGLAGTATYQNNVSGEKLYYQYSYDSNLRPTTTALTYNATSYTLTGSSYDKLGRLKRVVTGNNLQGTDYVYTLNGGLKAINHPGLDPSLDPGGDSDNYTGSPGTAVNEDLFGEIIEFYNNDYERSSRNIVSSISAVNSKYDNLVYALRFKTRSNVNATLPNPDYIDYGGGGQSLLVSATNYQQQELRFEYAYDQFNQLASSVFGTYTTSTGFTQRSDYSETGASSGPIGYDRNGNINRLVRQSFGGTTLDNLTYTNGSSSNQLTAIVDAATNGIAASVNFRTPSTGTTSAFAYNACGQLTLSPAEDIGSITYFPNGKLKKVTYTSSGNTVEYEYGPKGEKLKSKYYLAASNQYKYTWYVGPYIYEYDEAAPTPTFHIAEVQVPTGVIRVNNSTLSGGYLVYAVTDHLGNVRATYKASGTGNGIDLLSFNDYYAFGGILPGRSWTAEDYRFAFQGQEKGSTGTPWYNFELRQYNPDLGRWFAPDPYGQFASPYLAMGNNPVSTVDPDGGQVSNPTGNPQEFTHKREMDYERDLGIGAFARDAFQQRYEDELNNLKQYYLGNDYGRRNDVSGYIAAVGQLNAQYQGLTYFSNVQVAYKNGTEYLTQSEMSLNSLSIGQNQSFINNTQMSRELTHIYVSTGEESMKKFVRHKSESINEHTASLMITTMFYHDDGSFSAKMVREINSDGTSFATIYDANGTSMFYRWGNEVGDAMQINSKEEVMIGNENGFAQGGGGGPMAAALTFAGAASLADGPLPFGEVVGAAAIIGTAIYVGIKGTNEKHVGDRPKLTTTYQPVSQNPIHSPMGGIDPENPNGWSTGIKWGLVGFGAYRALQEYQDNLNTFNFGSTPAVRDNTNVSPTIGPPKIR